MHLDLTPRWLDNLLSPDNPFVPWLLIMDLAAILIHLYIVYWVYRDASWRYNRGAPWGLIAALIPLGGWLFYLAYRSSPLVEFDRIDSDLFDDVEHTWTDYDAYKANRGQGLFKELFAREEGGGYSAVAKLSRWREQRRKLTPEERADVRTLRLQRKADARRVKAERGQMVRDRRKQRKQAAIERQTVLGLHGASERMSDRKQRALRRKLAMVEQLKTLPREDQQLEQLIYEMKYREALEQTREALEVAREMNDQQGQVTYEAYVERLERLAKP